MLGKDKAWLFGKEKGGLVDRILNSVTSIALTALMLVIIGYSAKALMDSLNITDLASLPLVGGVFAPLENTMSTGASLVVVVFLITIIGGLGLVFKRLRSGQGGEIRM